MRQAKFGIWFHYGPQANLSSGDWSAQHMYQQGAAAYNYHLNNFGHPTTNGYKDVLRAWNPTNYSPAGFAQLFHDAGARFVGVQTSSGSCVTPAPGATGTITCALGFLPATRDATAQIVVKVAARKTTLANTASVTSATPDPNPANDAATIATQVR